MGKLDEVVQPADAAMQTLKAAIAQELRVAMPGIVQSFDPATQTAVIQPAIRDRLGDGGYEEMPLLLDVPVFFPGGAGSGITFPVQAGDECLVIFADLCRDAWLQSGGVQNPVMRRRHDLSDAFAFVGFRSNRNRLTQFSETPSFFGQVAGGAGTPGADGKSAYQIALDNGFVGTVTEWLLSLQGEKGDKGDPGAPGEKGDPGAPGKDGLTTKVNGITHVNGEISLPASAIPADGGMNVQAAITGARMATLWTGSWSTGQITLSEAAANFRLLMVGSGLGSFSIRPGSSAHGILQSLWQNEGVWHSVDNKYMLGMSGNTMTMTAARKYLNGNHMGDGDALTFVYGFR